MVPQDRVTLEVDIGIGTLRHSVISADLCNLRVSGDLQPFKDSNVSSLLRGSEDGKDS